MPFMLWPLDISTAHVSGIVLRPITQHSQTRTSKSAKSRHHAKTAQALHQLLSMRAARRTVLYVGNDPLLSKSTCGLLRTNGYGARTCMPGNVRLMLRNTEVHVLVLCATMSSEESDQVVATVFEERPNVPIVSIHVGLLGDRPHPASTYVVDALAGPNALIAAMQSATALRRAAEPA